MTPESRWQTDEVTLSLDDGEIYRAVPGAIVEMLPGLGHTPILEDPARTASSLLAFIVQGSVCWTGRAAE